jgi:hypothetical protein
LVLLGLLGEEGLEFGGFGLGGGGEMAELLAGFEGDGGEFGLFDAEVGDVAVYFVGD